MIRRVYGGTEPGNVHLCSTCRECHRWVEGGRERQRCGAMVDTWSLRRRVSQCSRYSDKRVPYVSEYKEIAWELMTNKGGRAIGFRAPRRRDSDEPAAPVGF